MGVNTLARSTERLVKKYGQPMVLIQSQGGTFDAATQTYSGGVLFSYPIQGIVSPAHALEHPGSTVLTGDLLISFSERELRKAGVIIRVGDVLEIEGEHTRVVEKFPIAPGGVPSHVRILARGSRD